MYVAQSESTSDVCTVADECVARMIKSLGPRHGEIFCYNLFYSLQSRKTTGASDMRKMKNALVRLSDAIKYLPAYKVRFYVRPFLSVLSDVVTVKNDMILVKI